MSINVSYLSWSSLFSLSFPKAVTITVLLLFVPLDAYMTSQSLKKEFIS